MSKHWQMGGGRAGALIVALGMMAIAAESANGEATFAGLGVPEGDDARSLAARISADGGAAVGSEVTFEAGVKSFVERPVRWMGGNKQIMTLPANAVGRASGVSVNGTTVVGAYSVFDEETRLLTQASFRWTQADGLQTLVMPEGIDGSGAVAVSTDGATIVGSVNSEDGIQAFRWTQAGGTQGLGFFPDGIESRALGVSGDGTVIVGFGHHADGIRAFRWTAQDRLQNLGILQGGKHSRAAAVSMNGEVIVGGVENEDGTERAFRWTAQQGMTELPAPQGTHSWVATSASSDGSVIVGQMVAEAGVPEAFVWDAANGMRSVKAVLEAANVTVGDWRLDIAMGVSADGKTIVGAGVNPDGKGEAWRAVLP